jgi:hypothetical protein
VPLGFTLKLGVEKVSVGGLAFPVDAEAGAAGAAEAFEVVPFVVPAGAGVDAPSL